MEKGMVEEVNWRKTGGKEEKRMKRRLKRGAVIILNNSYTQWALFRVLKVYSLGTSHPRSNNTTSELFPSSSLLCLPQRHCPVHGHAVPSVTLGHLVKFRAAVRRSAADDQSEREDVPPN